MKIDAFNRGALLTLSLCGRLDAEGAGELDAFLVERENARNFSALLLDMAQVSYVSSAGLRVFTREAKALQSRDGVMAICSLQAFCRDVMRITGLQNAFNIFDTQQEARGFCLREIGEEDMSDGMADKADTAAGSFKFWNGTSGLCASLAVSGELAEILHARVNRQSVHPLKDSDMKYSFGIGALGERPAGFLPALGDMLCVDGAVFLAPANQGMPDFLIPADDEGAGELLLQTAFGVALDGDFTEYALFESSDPLGAPLAAVQGELLRLCALRHENFKGLLWNSMIAFAGAVYGRSLKRAPLFENRPQNDKSIDHPVNIDEWYDCDALPRSRDSVCLVSGVVADLMRDLSDYSELLLDRMFYMNPAALGGKEMLALNHAAVFRNAGYNREAADFKAECRRIASGAELERVCELRENSRIKSALIAIAPIEHLETPAQLDTLFARTLDYKLNRNLHLLQSYKNMEQ